MSQNLINTIATVVAVGACVALNLVVAGLIVISVTHDGSTASQVATLFQGILQNAISAIGPIIGGLLTGGAIIIHQRGQQTPPPTTTQP